MIVCDPEIQGGQPTIHGTRLTISSIVGRVLGGDSRESIMEDYDYIPLTNQDIDDALTIHERLMRAYVPQDYVSSGKHLNSLLNAVENLLRDAKVQTISGETGEVVEIIDNREQLKKTYVEFLNSQSGLKFL